MHILLGLLTVLGIVAFWVLRARAAAHAARDLLDVADDVRLAARRFGFSKRPGQHPIDATSDLRVVAAGMMAALAAIRADLGREEMEQIKIECRAVFGASGQEAADIAAIGRWLMTQCSHADAALERLTRRFHQLSSHDKEREDIVGMMQRVAETTGALNLAQESALNTTPMKLRQR